MTKKEVSVAKLARLLDLNNFTEQVNLKQKKVCITEINRPALQLHGYFEHFAEGRVQIIGMVEFAYLQQVAKERKREAYDKFMSFDIPCVVFCRGFQPDEDFLEAATRHNVAVLGTERATSALTAELIRTLNEELAPCITIHGVLVDVYGEGVLIMGESGIGKSEAALELIKRGHRLVADDVVEIKKVSEATLLGSAPNITRHFIELRGIGIIDVKSLFGVECVKLEQSIDLVINLEEWSKDTEYDRLGLEDQYTEFLGNRVVSHNIPIRPGRNIAIIVESAAVNHRQKKMGYNAAQELYNRVTQNIMKGSAKKED